MGFDDDICNGGLVLRLGFSSNNKSAPLKTDDQKPKKDLKLYSLNILEPSLSLGLETYDRLVNKTDATKTCKDPYGDLCRQDSAASSFSNASVKREREFGSDDAETERVSSRISDEDDDGSNGGGRKKLRLTKAQSALLEESFKRHNTLNPKQKLELARNLNLTPRQVEVWFQNRRARTKLKQTEVDCEFLKKCCETLRDENRRLQKELQELKALKIAAQPLYMQLPAATLTMCPSCEKIGATVGPNTSKNPFSMSRKPHHLFNSFPNPSAAC